MKTQSSVFPEIFDNVYESSVSSKQKSHYSGYSDGNVFDKER